MNLSVTSLTHPLSQSSPLANSNTEMLADNPWQARPTSAVESSLSTAELSPIYEKAFRVCSPQRGKIPLSTVRSLLALDGLSPATNDQILVRCVNPGDNLVNRNTFKLILALAALAQKNMDSSFENVLLYMNDLPAPSLPGLDTFNASGSNPGVSRSPSSTLRGGMNTKIASRSSLRFINDPWLVTAPEELAQIATSNEMSPSLERASIINSTTGLKSAPSSVTHGLAQDPPMDVITVHPHDQLEGFIFKHLNYVVTSERFSSRVLRRYSEFHALYKYFLGKYHYRLIPDIPPKRLGASDEFLERRRKGLYRFMNFICNHPVLGNDDYLKVFLSEPQLSSSNSPDHSSQASNEIDLSIDFHIKENSNTDYLLQDVPPNLELQLDNLYIKLKPILTHFNAMINVVDKISRRVSADAADLAELSRNNSRPLSGHDGENDSYPSDAYFPDEQFPFIMIYLQKLGVIMSNNSDALDDNVVETLKCLRDVAQGMNSLLSRSLKRPLVDEDKINRRIKNNNITINFLSKEPGADPREIEKLKASIEEDRKKLLHNQISERFVRRTLWSEYQLYRDYQVRTTVQLLQDLINDQVNFCNLSVHNWKALADQLALLS